MTLQLLLGAVAALPLTFASEPAETAPAALLELTAPTTLPLQGPVVRHRTVAVRTELFEDAAASGGRLSLEPFPGERYEVRGVRVEEAWGGGRVYWGSLHDARGAQVGSATVSVFADAIAASLRLDDGLLRIEPAGSGLHRVVEIDEFRMPTCGTTGEQHLIPPTEPSAGAGGQASTKAATNLPTVDILVAYTPAAASSQGGTNGINAMINLAVTESNNGYASSDVEQRYRLVHTFEATGYNETGNFSTELNRFRNNGDGYIDEVHALRNQYGADACCLIVNGSQYCGIAYGVMGAPSHSFQVNAFQVTARTCATGYYSFSHEFGHLFGSHHDKANAGNAYWPYGYGWRTSNGAWRTVMAYAPGTRINRWSNPGKSYNGQVLGLAGQAENFRSLNNNKAVTSQWRCAVPQNYCNAKISSSFGYPTMSWSGKPVSNGSGSFKVAIQGAEPNKFGIVFWGLQPGSGPLLGGTLCVAPPITRLPAKQTDASGYASFDFPITQFLPGDEVYVQGWFRDPAHPDGTGAGLTDGLRIDVCLYNN